MTMAVLDPKVRMQREPRRQLRNRVTSYADLRTELVGAVEQLIDFVSA